MKNDITEAQLVPLGPLARYFNVGTTTVLAVATNAGIKSIRTANRRIYFTFQQVLRIQLEMEKRANDNNK